MVWETIRHVSHCYTFPSFQSATRYTYKGIEFFLRWNLKISWYTEKYSAEKKQEVNVKLMIAFLETFRKLLCIYFITLLLLLFQLYLNNKVIDDI